MSFILLIAFLISYLIGSIPTGYWLAKFCFGIDITEHGSGNIGATNVGRVFKSKKLFALIFILDTLKSYFVLFAADNLSIFIGKPLTFNEILILAIIVLIGNSYSIFLRFKGGKGVATTIGLLAFVSPIWLGIFLCIGVPLLLFTKQVDVSMLSGISLMTLIYMLLFPRFGHLSLLFFFMFLTMWLLYRHRDNLKRLQEGKAL